MLRAMDSDGEAAVETFTLASRYLYGEMVDQLLADEQYHGGAGPELSATTASATAGDTYWALTDHLGSVRDLVDNSGEVRQHVAYDSFGNRIVEQDYDALGSTISSSHADAIDELFGYTGRDWDVDAGLQNNRARWYDPATGRWLSNDPIGFNAGDANLYRYVGNGPANASAPRGLFKSAGPAIHAEITQQALAVLGINPAHRMARNIVTYNTMTDVDRLLNDEYHAQGRNFPKLPQKLTRDIANKKCNSQRDYEGTTVLIGNALHLLQDFYSHTDWIDGKNLILNYTWYRVRFGQLGDEGEPLLMQEAANHQPHNSTIDLDAIFGGDFSEIDGVIIFGGGFDPRGSSKNSKHNHYAADKDGFGGDDLSHGGRNNAFENAKRLATQQSVEFLLWVQKNAGNCDIVDHLRKNSPLSP